MEINSGSSTIPIPDDTRLLGQRPSSQGGAPVPFSVEELTDKIMGGGGDQFIRPYIKATQNLLAIAEDAKAADGVSVIIEGSPTVSHTVKVLSGVPGRVNKQADHAHLKHDVTTVTVGSAASRGQLMYSGRTDGTSSYNLHGYGAEITGTPLENEHSIDTTGMTVGSAPAYLGTLKVRHTVNHGLVLNQLVMLAVTGPVAGIQASVYYGIVTQVPTLAGGLYETLVQVARLDPNHWDTNAKASTPNLNDRWAIKTLVNGEVNAANKVSLARDTSGPTDQLLVTWSTAHNLAYGQNVSVWASGTITGLSGIWTGFHSGHVTEIVSATQVRIRVRNLRLQSINEIYNFTGAVTSATSTWAVVPGTLDPDHEVCQSGNVITAHRDAIGRTRRLMVGDVDVTNDDEWGINAGTQDNALRGRGGDVRIGRHSITTMAGSRSPRRGVRCIRNAVATAALVTTSDFGSIGTVIGAGEFSAVFDCLLDFSGGCIGGITDTACLFQLRLLSTGDIALDTWDGTTTTVTNLGASLLHLNGTRGVVSIRRGASDLSVSINGIELYSGSPTSWNRTISSAAKLRVGGTGIADTRYNSVIYGAWAFAHRVTRADLDHITAHGRIPTALQWAPLAPIYTDQFSAGDDSWSVFGLTATGNVDNIGSRDDCLRLTIVSGGTSHSISKALLPRAKRVRVTLEVYRPASNQEVTGIIVQPYNQGMGRLIAQIDADTWSRLTLDVEDFGVTGSLSNLIISLMNGSGAFIFSGNGTDSIAIRNVMVQRLGAFAALDFTAGSGSQAADITGNAFHSVLTTPFEHVVAERRFQIFQRVSQSGNNTAIAIPTNARIVSLTANAAGSVTLSVGNVGSGTQIVNAQALTSGIQDVTLAGRFSSTGNLVANLSSGVSVDLTFECVMTGA